MDISTRIRNWYQSHSIYFPEQIDLDRIADLIGLSVYYLPHRSCCLKIDGHYDLVVDRREERTVQRVHLAHEIGHAVLHTGNQTENITWGRLRQEYQARKFAFEALVPSFMLQSISILTESLSSLAERFRVPEPWMYERLIWQQERVAERGIEYCW
ncbi:hypothetical protein SD51_12100 [Alicyclobacillus tengchongensis]|nr:hypothetical protein SD51_12100 [Alicyclobacillus tengchongensis]